VKSKSKKTRIYPEYVDTVSVVQEAAPKYETLHGILGGNKSSQSFEGDFNLIAITREGIKKSSLKSLAGYLGISMETMSGLLHSSYRNLQRKDDDELLDTLKTEKALELAAFVRRGIEVIGNESAFIEWVHSPLMAFGHKPPVEFLDTSFGIQMATRLLGRLEQGVYS
jgi:putative toxin-antitoxin system antitoxin component (TIGR02293 family)